MDKILRCITTDGAVMVSAIDSSDIVHIAKKIHKTTPSATAALGRLLTGTSMMGAMLKQKDASINLRIAADGPLGVAIAVADSNGNVRGYVGNANCPTEHYSNGKINVAKAVGTDGVLNVMRDYGTGEPYIGQVPLVSGEIAEDITNYYATSEQIPTACALGVLIDKADGEVLFAGGFLIQLLPGADDIIAQRVEENVKKLEPVTTMLANGMTPLDMAKKALDGFDVEVLDEYPIHYICTCSKEKIAGLIKNMGKEEISAMIKEDKGASAHCHFCNKTYNFSEEELEKMLDELS